MQQKTQVEVECSIQYRVINPAKFAKQGDKSGVEARVQSEAKSLLLAVGASMEFDDFNKKQTHIATAIKDALDQGIQSTWRPSGGGPSIVWGFLCSVLLTAALFAGAKHLYSLTGVNWFPGRWEVIAGLASGIAFFLMGLETIKDGEMGNLVVFGERRNTTFNEGSVWRNPFFSSIKTSKASVTTINLKHTINTGTSSDISTDIPELEIDECDLGIDIVTVKIEKITPPKAELQAAEEAVFLQTALRQTEVFNEIVRKVKAENPDLDPQQAIDLAKTTMGLMTVSRLEVSGNKEAAAAAARGFGFSSGHNAGNKNQGGEDSKKRRKP